MYILAIETTGAFASVALMEDNIITAKIQGTDRFSHLQNLMPQIETVIKERKLSLDDLSAIAVSCGPGSFTGIRIGVSSARALAQVLGIPCVAVSSLEALALRAVCKDADGVKPSVSCKGTSSDTLGSSCKGTDSGKLGSSCEGVTICPMLDARRNQVYAGGYIIEDGYPKEVIKAGPYMLDEFLSKTEDFERILLLGDAADKYGDKIGEIRNKGVETAPEDIRYQDASTVAMLGAKLYEAGKTLDYNQVKPNYMRLAEAERKLKEQQQAAGSTHSDR